MKRIKKVLRDKVATKLSKIEVLCNYWDKMIGIIQNRATALKDKQMTEVCQQILLIPKSDKHAILEKYLS